MDRRQRYFMLFAGSIMVAVAVALWWRSEVANWLGDQGARGSFHCLVFVGTGNCRQLWWIGLHQTNQFASIAFWAAIVTAIWTLIRFISLGRSEKS
jgi:hypothetical protein